MDSYAIHFFFYLKKPPQEADDWPGKVSVRRRKRKRSKILFYFQEGKAISDLFINEQIRDKEVRVIGENGEQLGIMSSREALKLAEDAGVDLVKIAPTAKPPVCKIVDYGKF